MKEETQKEIRRCLEEYQKESQPDKEGALRGLNDWFLQGLLEDGLIDLEEECSSPRSAGPAKRI